MSNVKIYTAVSEDLSPLIHGEGFCVDMVRYSDYAALESKCAALLDELGAAEKLISELEAESEERRQFILNGVEMGFIRLPDKDTRDPATATYERCLNGIQYMPCPKCNDTGMMDSGGTQPWGEPIEIECDCRQQDANTAELVAAGIMTKVGG